MLRIGRPALACATRAQADASISTVVRVFCEGLAPQRDPELRVALLALLDAFIVGSGEAPPPAPPSHSDAGSGGVSGVRPPSRSDLATIPLDHEGPEHTRTHRPSTAPLDAAAALPRHVSRMLDEAPVTALSSPSDAPLRHALAGGLGVHTVSDATVDDVLVEGEGSARLLAGALLPGMVWQVGLVASAIRKVSLACLHALLRRKLLPPPALKAALQHGELLATLRGAVSDDDAATRLVACLLLGDVFHAVKGGLDGPTILIGLQGELLKRLDDGNDAVRIAACGALGGLLHASARPADLAGSPAEYAVSTLLVHLDDPSEGVAEAAYAAVQPWAELARDFAAAAAAAARGKQARPAFTDRLLGHLGR